MSKTILVTGGAGFIGSRFVQYLLDHYPEYRIFILDALTYAGSTDNLPVGKNRQVDFWYGNVCNSDLVSTLTATSDIVVHFAAETHVTRSIYDNRIFFETDVLGTQSVANAVLRHAGRIERFIHISTSEVYGTARTEKMDEAHPLEPSSPYAAAKCGADRLVASYVTTYGIPAVIVRPFNTFGPFQHLEKLIPRFITSAILGEPLTIHGDGTAARDFIYVEDVCRAVDLIMHASAEPVIGEVFNVASGKHRSIVEIADDIIRLTGIDPALKSHLPDRPGQILRHTGNASKLARTLDWHPATDWIQGLQTTIDWFRSNRTFWQNQVWMRSIEITLPDGGTVRH